MQGKRQAAGPLALAASLGKVTRSIFRRRGFAQADVVNRWPAIVGDELAAWSCPEKLSFAPGAGAEGTLQVRVAGAFAIEMQHLEPLVVERINGFFGYRAVARLAIRQGPLPERPVPRRKPALALDPERERALARSVEGTAHASLRTALHDLGRRIEAEGGRD